MNSGGRRSYLNKTKDNQICISFQFNSILIYLDHIKAFEVCHGPFYRHVGFVQFLKQNVGKDALSYLQLLTGAARLLDRRRGGRVDGRPDQDDLRVHVQRAEHGCEMTGGIGT